MVDVAPPLQNHEQEKKESGFKLSTGVESYITEKSHSSAETNKQITEVVTNFINHDAAILDQEIAQQYPNREKEEFDVLMIEGMLAGNNEVKRAFAERALAKAQEKIQGQESKQEHAQFFIGHMMESAIQIAREAPAEQRQQVLKDHLILIEQAVDAISHQDQKAARLTLGDHGWMHLIQDYRDSMVIAEGLKGQELSAKDKLLLGLTSAYHDIGYANPGVHEKQLENPKNYDLDKGHPAVSAAYVVMHSEQFMKVLNDNEFKTLYTIVLKHEGIGQPKDMPAPPYLVNAFEQADASATFGKDKLPAVIGQVPEAIQYLALLNLRAAQEKGAESPTKSTMIEEIDAQVQNVRTELQNIIDARFPGEKEDIKRALEHFSGNSLGFVLGRVAGELSPVRMEGDTTVLTVNAGLAEKFDMEKYFNNAREAVVKLTIKLFDESGGLNGKNTDGSTIDKSSLKLKIQSFLQNPSPDIPTELRSVVRAVEGDVVTLFSHEKNMKIMYDPHTQLDTDPNGFVTQLVTQLEAMRDVRARIERRAQEKAPTVAGGV